MTPPELESIDQAIFGYSEGHRQIAGSVRLPAGDLYRLSAATDLATGTKLEPDESYITGVPLDESKRYALIRTWSAPELARPGCVWSHVLLLDARVLASRADLHELLQCFRRPRDNFKTYDSPTPAPPRSVSPAVLNLADLENVIQDYYSARAVLLSSATSPEAVERIVTAVWSQQWPRLRSSFTFRTARSARRKSDVVQYDLQVGAPTDIDRQKRLPTEWAMTGARDAASGEVTNLRRFLWRYGRDVSLGRTAYRLLIELFLAGEGRSYLPTQEALRVFSALPDPADGEILKKDILGVPTSSPSLSPTISPIGLLDVLTDRQAHQLVPPTGLAERFRNLDHEEIGPIARHLDLHYDDLAPWRTDIEKAITDGADETTLAQEFPARLRMDVLRARPDLVTRSGLGALSDREIEELFDHYPDGAAADALAHEAVRRNLGSNERNRLVRTAPARLFGAALDALAEGNLNSAWKGIWRSHAGQIFEAGWPANESSWSRIAAGLAYLGYPRRLGPSAQNWCNQLRSITDDLTSTDRMRLQGYLLRTALDEGSVGTWQLCVLVLPELRPIIMQGALPDDVYQMLAYDLPRFNTAAYWDINRRILICLSYLRKTVRDDASESALGLSDDDRDVLVNGTEEEEESKRLRSWWS